MPSTAIPSIENIVTQLRGLYASLLVRRAAIAELTSRQGALAAARASAAPAEESAAEAPADAELYDLEAELRERREDCSRAEAAIQHLETVDLIEAAEAERKDAAGKAARLSAEIGACEHAAEAQIVEHLLLAIAAAHSAGWFKFRSASGRQIFLRPDANETNVGAVLSSGLRTFERRRFGGLVNRIDADALASSIKKARQAGLDGTTSERMLAMAQALGRAQAAARASSTKELVELALAEAKAAPHEPAPADTIQEETLPESDA